MINKKRLILYIFAFIILLIMITIIILLSKGFYFDFKEIKFRKLGMIAVRTIPRNADIYLNNNFKKNKTPLNISAPPGKYDLKIQKNGFITWQKQINVETGYVNRLDYVFLIFEDKPADSTTTEGIKNFRISPNFSKVAFVDKKDNIWIADIKTNEQKKIHNGGEQEQKVEIIDWSNNGKNLLISEVVNNVQIFKIISENEETLLKNIPGTVKKIEFISNADNRIFALSESNLYSLAKDEFLIREDNVSDFSQNTNNLFFVKNTEGGSEIWKTGFDFRSKDKLQEEKEKKVTLFPGPKNKLAYTSGEDKKLFYIENNNKEKINAGVLDVQWTKDEKKLAYRKSEEIYVYNIENNDPKQPKNLITTRLSKSINKCYWFYDSEHILFRSDRDINLIEIDGNNLVNLTNQAALTDVFTTTKYGRTLIFAEEKDGLINIGVMKLSEPEGLIPY